MGNIQFQDGKILFVGGKIAMGSGCCCDPPPDCPCTAEASDTQGFCIQLSGVTTCCIDRGDDILRKIQEGSNGVGRTMCAELGAEASAWTPCVGHSVTSTRCRFYGGTNLARDEYWFADSCDGTPTQTVDNGAYRMFSRLWYYQGVWYLSIYAQTSGINGMIFSGSITSSSCSDQLIIANDIESCEDYSDFCDEVRTPQTLAFGGIATCTPFWSPNTCADC